MKTLREKAHEIAKMIFYSPATNGKAEQSIENGVDLIMGLVEIQEILSIEKGCPFDEPNAFNPTPTAQK